MLSAEINYFIGEVLRVFATRGNLIYSLFKENILFRMKSIATGVSSLTALSSAALASLQVRFVHNISAISRVPGWRSQEFSNYLAMCISSTIFINLASVTGADDNTIAPISASPVR